MRSTEEALLVAEGALLGEGLPEDASWHLNQAAGLYSRDEIAERHLREALMIAPGHPAVLIGLYRFYFYKGRLFDALDISRECLGRAASSLGLPKDWRRVQCGDADFSDYGARLPRFYLFTLKAYAYLQLRIGAIDEAEEVVAKLLDLDATDKVGACVLRDVLQRRGLDDEDE